MTRFGYLSKVKIREDHGILILGRMQCRVKHIDQIGANRHMWSMLLHNAERQQAQVLRTLDGLDKIRTRQFFPMNRQFGLRWIGLRLQVLSRVQGRTKKEENYCTATLAIHLD